MDKIIHGDALFAGGLVLFARVDEKRSRSINRRIFFRGDGVSLALLRMRLGGGAGAALFGRRLAEASKQVRGDIDDRGGVPALLATWFVWAIHTYGVSHTVRTNTTAWAIEDQSWTRIAVMGGNAVNVFVPYFFRSVPYGQFAQSDPPALIRDLIFCLDQTTIPFAWGIFGGLILVVHLRRLNLAPVVGRFWLMMFVVTTLLGIASTPELKAWGSLPLWGLPLIYFGICASRRFCRDCRFRGRSWACAGAESILCWGFYFSCTMNTLNTPFGPSWASVSPASCLAIISPANSRSRTSSPSTSSGITSLATRFHRRGRMRFCSVWRLSGCWFISRDGAFASRRAGSIGTTRSMTTSVGQTSTHSASRSH